MLPAPFVFEAIGTHWQIDILEELTESEQTRVFLRAQQRIESFDQAYSRFRPDSLVTQMAQTAGTYTLPADAPPLLKLYKDLYDLTDGAFTPLIGQVVADAGYDATYSLQPHQLHTPETWEAILNYEAPRLELKKPALLDFGAAGKGYLIDLIGQLLKEHGMTAFCIDAGGDILHANPAGKPLRIGLENPTNTAQVIGVAQLNNQSICASAGSRRKWGQFHHIINPHTLTSPQHILAVWVMADTALLADALATCLFFVPSKILAERYTFEYAVLKADSKLEKSAQFPAEFFYQ